MEEARARWAPAGVELEMMGRRRYEDYDEAFAEREAAAKAAAEKLAEEAKSLEKPGWFASSEAREAYAAQQEELGNRAQALEEEANFYRAARDTGFFGGRKDADAAEAAASAIDAERAAAEIRSVQLESESDPEPPRGGWLFGSAEHAEWSKREAERQRRLAEAQPPTTPTLEGPPKRPEATAPSKPTSRIPNRRDVPVNSDGTVSVWRAVGKGELEGTRREDARFFAPPGYKDVAQDYARRKGGYTGKMVEYRIPEDEYYRTFQRHEYRLDGTKAEIELPKGHSVDFSRYRKVVHDEQQAQAPDTGTPSSSSSSSSASRRPQYEEVPADANIWDKEVAAKMDPMEWQRRRAEQEAEEAARAKERAWAEEQAQKWRDARRS